MIDNPKYNVLLDFVFRHSFKRGVFRLSSGKESSFYLDMKQTTLDPDGSLLVAENVLDKISNSKVDSIGGLTIGADPIIGSVITLAAMKGFKPMGFIVRKKPKGHGLHRAIEGKLKKGDRVIIIDDVITTGGSAFKAIEVVENLGCKVIKVMPIVDRDEGGREFFNEKGYVYEPVINIKDIFQYEEKIKSHYIGD